MKRLRLFNEKDQWLPEGHNLDHDISEAIRPIVQRYARDGFSLRDIQSVILQSTFEVGLGAILDSSE